MKAIYINLDPYLQAVADWLNAGKPGTAPSFDPLPVAVTIPLGEAAAIYLPGAGEPESEFSPNSATIDGQGINFSTDADYGVPADSIATNVENGLSRLAPSAKYAVAPVTGNTSLKIWIGDSDGEIDLIYVTIPVLVRRETASGPVDLVDFAPPAAAIAAGTDLKGTKFNGNEIVAAAGTGALSAPAGA